MLILKDRATVDWTEWRHQATRGRWNWISPRARNGLRRPCLNLSCLQWRSSNLLKRFIAFCASYASKLFCHRCHIAYWSFCCLKCAYMNQRWALDWTSIGLDPDCKSLQNLGPGPNLDWVNAKEMRHFCCEKTAFFKYFGLHLDLDCTFEKYFGLWLDLDWVFKNQDWIWIANYDSPLISDIII